MATITSDLNLTTKTPLYKFSILTKRAQFALDLVVLIGGFIFAYLLRFDFASPRSELSKR